MSQTSDLSLLFEWVDKKLPVTDYIVVGNSIQFKLFEQEINICISELEDLELLEWVSGKKFENPKIYKGFLIDITIKDIDDGNIEFFIFTECLDQINKLLLQKSWDYLIIRGLVNQRNKVHEAIAQRLTKLQSSVERLSCRSPCFMIARF